jgi:hypothetical protein
MAQLGTKFKATEHDTTQNDYPELPNGIYDLEIIQSEVKDTSGPKGKGKMLALRISVVAPEEQKGRLLFNNIMLEHDVASTQEIGQKTFAKLCRALEVDEVDDSDELHFKSFRAKIGLGKPSKEKNADDSPVYPARAEIKAYYYPDEGDMPEVGVTDPVASNDNRKPANDNRPASGDARTTGNGGAAATGKSRPWGKAK